MQRANVLTRNRPNETMEWSAVDRGRLRTERRDGPPAGVGRRVEEREAEC